MRDLIGEVEKFMRLNGSAVPARPTARIGPEVVALRLHLMLEELGEISRGLNEENLPKVADGIADLLFVVIGTGLAAGLGPILPQLLREVCESNLTKDLGARWPGDRGARKGERYRPPRIAKLLDDYADALKKVEES